MARVVRVRSVDEAEEVNAEADKDAEADKRTFAPDVEAIAKGGLAKALPEVDARLTLAMRGESAGAQSDTDADALTAKRAASTAEDQAVDIVACLKQCGDLRGYGGARLVPRRDYALSELKLNGIEIVRKPSADPAKAREVFESLAVKFKWHKQVTDFIVDTMEVQTFTEFINVFMSPRTGMWTRSMTCVSRR